MTARIAHTITIFIDAPHIPDGETDETFQYDQEEVEQYVPGLTELLDRQDVEWDLVNSTIL